MKTFKTIAAMAGTAVLVLAGCSSTSTDDASEASASAPAASTAASAATESEGESDTATDPVAEALALAQPYAVRPTEIDVVAPINGEVPSGKRINFLTCSSPGCAQIAEKFVEAADILGWETKVLTVDPTADSIGKAYNTTIRDLPDAVAVAAVSSEVVKPQLAKLEELGIPVVTVQDPDVKFGPIIASLYTSPSSEELGKVTADHLISRGCADGTSIYVQVDGYLVLDKRLEFFNKEVQRLKPDMKVTMVNIGAGTEDPQAAIVGAVRSDPETSCVYLSSDGFISGLPQALTAAGVQNLPKIITDFGGETTLQYIKDGLVDSTNLGDPGGYGYIYLDTLARHFAGDSTAPDEEALQSIWWIDASNLPADVPTSHVADLSEQYAAQWGR